MYIKEITDRNESAFNYMFVEKIPLKVKMSFLIYHLGQAENDEEYEKLFKQVCKWSLGAIDSICSCGCTISDFKEFLDDLGYPDNDWPNRNDTGDGL